MVGWNWRGGDWGEVVQLEPQIDGDVGKCARAVGVDKWGFFTAFGLFENMI